MKRGQRRKIPSLPFIPPKMKEGSPDEEGTETSNSSKVTSPSSMKEGSPDEEGTETLCPFQFVGFMFLRRKEAPMKRGQRRFPFDFLSLS